MKITLAGMGPGETEMVVPRAIEAVKHAGLVIGSQRLLEGLPTDCQAEKCVLVDPLRIKEKLNASGCTSAVVLFSGDTGFYSGAAGLLAALKEPDPGFGKPVQLEVIPGISSETGKILAGLDAALCPWQEMRSA